MDHARLEELATQALNYLNDNDMLEEFLENYDLELTETERNYFGIESEVN